MAKITLSNQPRLVLCTGDITTFSGDALICPSDVVLTDHHTSIAKLVLEKGGKDLVREATAIGVSEIGCAVITDGYNLSVKHVIFVPVKDREERVIDQILLHQAIRSALTLADLYKVETLAVPMLNPRVTTKPSIFSFLSNLNDKPAPETMSDGRVLDIITAVAKDFAKSSLQEISIYRNTKPQTVPELLPTKFKKQFLDK